MRKKKYFIFIIVAVILLIPSIQFALGEATTELKYPQFKFGLNVLDKPTSLITFIEYIFIFLIVTAGLIGLISIVIAGITLFTAFGNPAAIGDARDRIFGSIGGIVILMISYVLLTTINAALIKPSEKSLLLVPGVYLTDAKHKEFRSVTQIGISDTKEAFKSGYSQIYYYCTGEVLKRNILVRTYNETDFHINKGGDTYLIKCGDNNPKNILGVSSLRWDFEDTGIYFLKDSCPANLSNNSWGLSTPGPLKASGVIPWFNTEDEKDFQFVSSMVIVNGKDPLLRYGVILGKGNSLDGGECSAPYINTNTGGPVCFNILNDVDKKFFIANYARVMHYRKPGFSANEIKLSSSNLDTVISDDDMIGASYYHYQEDYDYDNTILEFQGNYIMSPGNPGKPKKAKAPEEWCEIDKGTKNPELDRDICINSIYDKNKAFYTVLYSKSVDTKGIVERKCAVYTVLENKEIMTNLRKPGDNLLSCGEPDASDKGYAACKGYLYDMYIIPGLPAP